MRSELLVALAIALAGCAAGNDAPVVEAVTPALVSNLVETPVRVHGHNFFLEARADLGGGSAEAAGALVVALDDRALAGATRLGDRTLEVVVPRGTPAGTYDVVVTLPGGARARAAGALTVTSDPIGLPLTIEDAPGGAGGAIGARTLIAGDALALHAVVRRDGAFIADVPVTWSVDGGIGALADVGPATDAQLEARRAGTGVVRAHHATAGDAVTGALTVDAGAATAIAIVDGAGADVGDRALTTDDRLDLRAEARDAFGNRVGPAEPTWAVTGAIGAIVDRAADAAVLDPTRPGAGTVVASTATLGGAFTGTLTIAAGRAATLAITPATLTRSADDPPVAFAATAVDADGNATPDLGALTWSVASGPIGDLDATGLLDPRAAGTGTLAVSSSHGASAVSGDVTIVPGRAASLAIAPATFTGDVGDPPVTFTAAGTDADGNPTADLGALTWSIASGPIGVLDAAAGRLTPRRAGVGRVAVTSSHGAAGQSGAVTLHGDAHLTAALAVPGHVTEGATFTVTMTVTSDGVADALAVAPSALAATGGLARQAGPAPASADVPIGGTATFVWTYRATAAGPASLAGAAAGTDGAWGTVVVAAPASAPLVIDRPPILSASLALPTTAWRDTTFAATMTVVNRGDAAALLVAPSALTPSGTGAAVLLAGPAPRDATIAGGGQASFTWTYRATTAGPLAITGSAGGVAAGTGAAVTSPPATSPGMLIVDAQQVDGDPFGNGTRVGRIFGYGGRAYVGGDRTGTVVARFEANGVSGGLVSFAFARDVTGNPTANASAAPYPSIGSSGCNRDTATCGPDNEDAGALFGAVTVEGVEWLVTGGGSTTGELDHVYVTRGTGASVAFSYVDLAAVLGGGTGSLSALHAHGERVYLGFADAGGGRPGLVALTELPHGAGLDAVPGVDAVALAGADLGAAGAGTAMIDVIGDFQDRLFVASARAWLRSTVIAPRPYASAPGDWAVATPSAAAYTQLASRTTSRTVDLEPGDRAVTQVAAFGGRLFVGRNTVTGPQLWACSPAATGDPTGCDPGDWALVAANANGDARLTQLGESDNGAISMVVATTTHLLVGFDGTSGGLRVYRTTLAAPTAADFEGPLGGAGFGSGGRRRILSSAVIGDAVFVMVGVGTGAGAASLWRLPR